MVVDEKLDRLCNIQVSRYTSLYTFYSIPTNELILITFHKLKTTEMPV